ncbi:MAG TPA: hypothetical protein VHR45_15205 [Thermoanaerobaculia bacterium]|nr:hypothetical protein [Thermoanaerobaculia bacterium]
MPEKSNRTRSSRGAIAAVAALVALSLATAKAHGYSYSLLWETDSFHDATDTKVFTHQIHEGRSGAKIRVKLALDTGKATCRLLASDGTVKWEQEFKPGKRKRASASVEGPAGVWRVELALDRASGRYNIRLSEF